jgi:hypothetical protein
MRKILFILLFFPVISNGQASITAVVSSTNFTTGQSVSFSLTKTAGRLYVVVVGVSNGGGTPATVSLSGTGETWTEIGSAGGALNTTVQARIQAFRFNCTSTLPSNTTSFSFSGSLDGDWFIVYEVTNVLTTGTNGADAIVQVVTSSNNSDTNPTITMTALSGRASVLAAFMNNINPFGGTAESGWSEDEDDGFSTPDRGGYSMTRYNTTDNTPSVTVSSSNWAGIAIEFKAAGRRIFNTN